MSLLRFITAIPWNVRQGSGCYVATRTLVEALRQIGPSVEMVTPQVLTPIYTWTRVLFNETLRWRSFSGDATVGIDADGYAIAGRRGSLPHIACIKGVLGDAVRFESGATRASLAFQARLEAKHARRADLVITVSNYCARRVEELYGITNAVVVSELIDLEAWRTLFREHPARPDPQKFTVLSVCRFYPRKRVDLLLRAAALIRDRIPQLELRIVGNGPEYSRLRQISLDLHLENVVRWLGDCSRPTLAAEYTRADVFCLPSSQEGFGIVFLEAMAAGKPIIAARAAAVPEVVQSGLLVEPGNHEAITEAIIALYRDPDLRDSLASSGLREVERFEMRRVASQFLSEVAKVAPGIKAVYPYQAAEGALR
ncbi:MAG: glycosyltransferase family 4 protein [Acidobacteriaceae bacterium]|nr:glycosyltransferase family 4 protein [Acidobacteriaceae bacterium]